MANDEVKRCSTAQRVIVWGLRIAVGTTFVFSGWSKSVDPWGFIYKLEEYLNVWGIVVPREMTLSVAVALSVLEFTTGILIVAGAMRRATIWIASAFMACMLPLTVYIAIANPVSDCGCFGDVLLISNMATMVKNIILTAMVVILLKYNCNVKGVYHPSVQWFVALGACLFSLIISFLGYRYQPLVDFRPYPVGSQIYADSDVDDNTEEFYIYEKNGEQRSFALDNLPDSTWTYVDEEVVGDISSGPLKVYDGDEDVTFDVLTGDDDKIFLAVVNPGMHYLTRARLANELSDYMLSHGGQMVALVAANGEELQRWKEIALPSYEVYSAEDTSLKELVRGDAGLVFVRDGKIIWKRNFSSVSHDIVRRGADELIEVDASMSIDNSRLNMYISGTFVLWLLLAYLMNYPNRILDRYLKRRSVKNS